MAGLGQLLELMHGARHRFRTVRAEVLELQAMAERDGTRAMVLSRSAPRDMVIDMALSLGPAPGDPPALTG